MQSSWLIIEFGARWIGKMDRPASFKSQWQSLTFFAEAAILVPLLPTSVNSKSPLSTFVVTCLRPPVTLTLRTDCAQMTGKDVLLIGRWVSESKGCQALFTNPPLSTASESQ